jgi:flagellin
MGLRINTNLASMQAHRHLAVTAIRAVHEAIGGVSTARADLGAVQNRFEHTLARISASVEDLMASASRIRDADVAREMVQFTRDQILGQAGTAMLARANESPQGILGLLT